MYRVWFTQDGMLVRSLMGYLSIRQFLERAGHGMALRSDGRIVNRMNGQVWGCLIWEDR